MNIETIRLKKKLSIMEIDGSNQVFIDLLRSVGHPITFTNERTIKNLKLHYLFQIQELEKKESKYKQIELL